MKNIAQLFLVVLPWLLFLFIPKGFCQRVHCEWGHFGGWSECDPCTKLQTRSRAMVVYAQFGGNPCDGGRTETRPCQTTRGCPLEEGCGDRFRCLSGKCISKSLVCNGDQDCEGDGLDERSCETDANFVCKEYPYPPGSDLLGKGFDAVTGTWRGIVIDTRSYGGQCRTIFSGVHQHQYRLPLSTIQYSHMVTAQSNFHEEMFKSEWEYVKNTTTKGTVTGTTTGHSSYNFLYRDTKTKEHRLLILKNDIEIAQFQSNSPQYLPVSEELWKALAKLPSVYDYAAYRKVLERFGTHYVSAGSLGGSLRIMAKIGTETISYLETWSSSFQECDRTVRWILFIPIRSTTCKKGNDGDTNSNVYERPEDVEIDVTVEGGDPQFTGALKVRELGDPKKNLEHLSNWADSIKYFPKITEKKLRPLSELVKEIQCAGVKKIYLRRAIEQYLAESHPCHCQPCRNNGIAVMEGNECKCICKPGTKGSACEIGAELDSQPGMIDGSWSCWSSWSSCSGNRRSRSRSCSNPSPYNGGQSCIGETTETSECEDQDLQHYRTIEPQCFDAALPPVPKCGTPPALINGYILEPKDIYLEGNRVEYTCSEGYYLVGVSTIQCTAAQTWSSRPGRCASSKCRLASLSDDVLASPSKQAYDIGEIVSLSCPEGQQLQGEATVICDPSLNFSPNPADITCIKVRVLEEIAPTVQCDPWQKSSRGECVCKMPFECGSSLELCATAASGTQRSSLLTVCKMHALQCIGKQYTITEESNCKWPQRNTAGCTKCHIWETCDDQANECRCKDTADCSTPGIIVCVRIGEDAAAAPQTMSECEAGLRRCKGEKVSLVSILPCAS